MREKVHATKTDSAGNGWYKSNTNRYYYGNIHNGYLRPTKDQLARDAAKNPKQSSTSIEYDSNSSSSNGSGSGGSGLSFLEVIAVIFSAGVTLITMVAALIIGTVLAILGTWQYWSRMFIVTFQNKGFSLSAIVATLPIILCVAAFVYFFVRTLRKHKYYVVQLLIAYFFFTLLYTIGGMTGTLVGESLIGIVFIFIQTSFGYVISLGILPSILLFLLRRIDIMIHNKASVQQ